MPKIRYIPLAKAKDVYSSEYVQRALAREQDRLKHKRIHHPNGAQIDKTKRHRPGGVKVYIGTGAAKNCGPTPSRQSVLIGSLLSTRATPRRKLTAEEVHALILEQENNGSLEEGNGRE